VFDWAFPGHTVTTFRSVLSPGCHLGRLRVGKAFLVQEGQRTRGHGVGTAILTVEAHARGRPCERPRVTAEGEPTCHNDR